MKAIYKYPITASGPLSLPEGFKPLSVQLQNNGITLWGEADLDVPYKGCTVHIIGTGWEQESFPGTYIGTVQERNLVWHIYLED